MNYDAFGLIKKLMALGTRQYIGEQQAARLLKNILQVNGVNFLAQQFETTVPIVQKAVLRCDGKNIPCLASGLVSGKIPGKEIIFSSLTPAAKFSDTSNINFNPLCEGISRANFYFAPALSVAKKDVKKILAAEKVQGEIVVNPQKYMTENLLVGNAENPQNIFFAHYDSVGKGAVDNASGIALLMKTILENPDLLQKNLFVFAANEELSYERVPAYYGRGYRVFAKENSEIIAQAEKIFVVDCVGYSEPILTNEYDLLRICFTVENLEKLQKKTFALTGDYGKLMRVYHSDDDNGKIMKKTYLEKTYNLIIKKLCKK